MYRDHRAAANLLPEVQDEVPARFFHLVAFRWARGVAGGVLLASFGIVLFDSLANLVSPHFSSGAAVLAIGWLAALACWPMMLVIARLLTRQPPRRDDDDALSRWQYSRGAARTRYMAERLRRIEGVGSYPLLLGISLALPLTMHIIAGLVINMDSDAINSYVFWATLASLPSHIIVAVHAAFTIRRTLRLLDEGGELPRFGMAGIRCAAYASLGPLVFGLFFIPLGLIIALVVGLVTVITGMAYLPATYFLILRRLPAERREIEAILQPRSS